MKTKLIIILILLSLSCTTLQQIDNNELEKYVWVIYEYKVIEEDEIVVVPFVYMHIRFEGNNLIFYTISGYATTDAKIVEVVNEESYSMDYYIDNDRIIAEELIFVFDQDGNLVIDDLVFIRKYKIQHDILRPL